ncbi:MAG TPA: hypothetical protein DCK83_01955 [Gallionellaceae bacterium]|nr:hypothetical protein [Gallionellaceae bacterium]
MALTFDEITQLIDSGKALAAIEEFTQFAVALHIGISTGQMEELPGTQATIVAAVALQKLMGTADGRKVLGIKASNKVFNEQEFGLNSPQLEIARRMGCGEITREQALKELSDHYHKADTYPAPQTLKRILSDLERVAGYIRGNLEFMLKAAGWDGDERNLYKILNDIRQQKKP